MQINRKDVGYTIYSRIEEALRYLVRDKLVTLEDWVNSIPKGVLDKVKNRSSLVLPLSDDPTDFLEETHLTELSEIICYKDSFERFVPVNTWDQAMFQDKMIALYGLRNKIAHVKRSFTAFDLDLLSELADTFLVVLGIHGDELRETLKHLKINPSSSLSEKELASRFSPCF